MGSTTPLIPKRKLDPDDRTLLNFLEALPDSPFRRIHANDAEPVLTLDQDGSGSNLLLESSAPELRYAETDQTDPAGRYRWRLDGDFFLMERALTADWATDLDLLQFGTFSVMRSTDDRGCQFFGGIGPNNGATIYLYGKDHVQDGSLYLLTLNAAEDAAVTRLRISGLCHKDK